MNDPDFTGVSSGGSPGFGGVDTGFSHGGAVHGGLETQPHDWVHGLVGGSTGRAQTPGLMSDPDTAALDPIFWLHHTNIDRLWQAWRQSQNSHVDPTDPKWVKGPASIGERAFVMPMPDGKTWTYTPGEMADLAKLGYTYDDFSPGVAPAAIGARIKRLGLAASAGTNMVADKSVQLVGASRNPVPVQGTDVRASVEMNQAARRRVTASLRAAESPAPDRVFLNLENVRGMSDAVAFHVYVGLPAGAVPDQNPDHLAGSIALFGVRKASMPTEEHGGVGLTFVLEITSIVDALHLGNAFDVDSLEVRLVPSKPISAEAEISIGRISISRQGKP